MTRLLEAVASLRLYADEIGLALLLLGFGLAGWFAWKARRSDRRRRGIW